MPDEPQLVRGIDWKTSFPFTMLFRSFRIAIHPSKLVLALLALLLIYGGGRILDRIWPSDSSAVPGEIQMYASTRGLSDSAQQFHDRRAEVRKGILASHKASLSALGKGDSGKLADIKWAIVNVDRKDAVDRAKLQYDEAIKGTPTDEQIEDAKRQRDVLIQRAYAQASQRWEAASLVKGVGLFSTILQYQIGQAHRVVETGRAGQWLGRGGMLDEFVNLLTVAPGWGLRHHYVYFTLFGIYFLVIWAIFGGAIARIAAVQVARDEKISFRQALSFSTAKFLSFLSAPVIPVMIIVVVGLVVTVVAFVLFLIPFLGPIAAGLLFFLALAAGFVMTLVLIGLVGGFNLMYPTIAVEGSDSFDAISRSFSYLFARPWRLGFYSLIAAIYGTFCYVFVRYFIKLMLSLTHQFTGMGVFYQADSTAPLWPAMWPDPLVGGRMTYEVDWLTLGGGQSIGAFLVAFWVYLALAMLGAFVISFYFSANTIIYVLMRNEVDATELDDVYLEQTDEDFGEPITAPTTTVGVTETVAATEPPPAPASEALPENPPPAQDPSPENPPESSGGGSGQA